MDSFWQNLLFAELFVFLFFIGPMFAFGAAYRRGNYRVSLLMMRWYYLLGRFLPHWRRFGALYLAQIYISMGDFESALPYAEEAVAAYERVKKPWIKPWLATAQGCLGVILTRQGHFDRAEALMDEALATGRMRPVFRSVLEINAATTYINRGRIDEAERLLDPFVGVQRPKPDIQAIAMNNRCLCYYLKGDLESAIELSKRAMEQPFRTPMVRPVTQISHMFYLACAGQIAEAQAMEALLNPQIPALSPHLQGAAYRSIARLALTKGNLDRARDYAERAARLDPNPNAQAEPLLIQAEVFATRQNLHRAVTLCEQVLRSDAIEFHKRRAAEMIQHLTAPQPRVAATLPDQTLTLGSSEA
jgi:tetratricopeptide (TPR) repeat protein